MVEFRDLLQTFLSVELARLSLSDILLQQGGGHFLPLLLGVWSSHLGPSDAIYSTWLSVFPSGDFPGDLVSVSVLKKCTSNDSVVPTTRETALLQAITAAAITHEITLQCRENKIPECRCVELKNRQPKGGNGDWQWGGCSDNIWFGENMTRSFIDSMQQGDNARKAVNLHNYDIGRKVVKLTMQRECLCHGVTGSCNFKTCWKSLAPFSVVGAVTKEMYHHAEKVNVFDDVLRGQDNKRVTRRDKKLVFLDSSPDYCVRNKTAGSLGLLGRTCRSDDVSTSKCKSLCDSCNLGHKTEEQTKSVRCRCKLVWCCSVECKTCTKNYFLTTCTPR
ncbi:protein Wnt-8b-like [Oculina patagonica]